MKANTSVEVTAMTKLKICSRCFETKEGKDYYTCKGLMRSECKTCTIKRNISYQKKTQAWKHRFIDNEQRKSYQLDYYAKNKEKFAEYRTNFKLKHPEYFKMYARQRKNDLRGKSEASVNNPEASDKTKLNYSIEYKY